jgi:hypothetical protein
MSSKLELNSLLVNLEARFQKAIVQEAFPKAADVIAEKAKAAMIPMLPDGIASGTRARQTDDVRKKFRYHMNRNVSIKPLMDREGVARLVGVEKKVGQVNFDMGEKAKKIGRLHVLWGKRLAKPPLRVQRQEYQDIPDKIHNQMAEIAERIAIEEVTKAMRGLQ